MLLRANVRSAVRRAQCPLLRIQPGGIRASRYSSPALQFHPSNQHTPFLDNVILGNTYKHPFPWHTPKGAPKDAPSQIRAKTGLKSGPVVEPSMEKAWDDAVTARLDHEFAKLEVVEDEVLEQIGTETASMEPIMEDQKGKVEWRVQELEPSWGVPVEGLNELDTRLMGKLNAMLHGARRSPYGDRKARELAGLYAAVKRRIPRALELVTDGVWKVLWRTQSMFRPMQLRRLEIMRTLAEDMTVAGKDTSRERMFLYLEEMAHSNKATEAAQKWEYAFAHQGLSWSDRLEWLELGARLHTYAGDIDRACALVIWAIKHHKTFDPRCMLFVVWKNAETGDKAQMRHAWAIYQKLKAQSSFVFDLFDYRSLVGAFLRGGHLKAAMQVINDLATNMKSPASERHVMGALEEVQMSCRSQKALSEMMLMALTFLPDKFNWSHFFRRWLEFASQFRGPPVDHCAQIIELMFELGHIPEAAHLNEMFRTWIRCDKARKNKALEIAWDMINKRLDEVFSSEKKAMEDKSTVDHKDTTAVEEDGRGFAKRALPSADARTFTLLARHYAQNERAASQSYRVLDLLGEADLPLSKRTVRDVLVIQFHIGNPVGTWVVFDELRKADIGSINLHVYNILWRSMSRHISLVNEEFGMEMINDERSHEPTYEEYFDRIQQMDEHGTRMPAPRSMFADMFKFIHTQHDRRAEPTPEFLLDHLVLSFLKAKDFLGAYVAMRTLRSVLNLTPKLMTIDSVVHYTALRAATEEEGYIIRQGKHLNLDQYKDMAYGVLEYILVNNAEKNQAGVRGTPHASDLYDKIYIARNGDAVLSTIATYLHELMVSQYGSEEALEQQERVCQIEMGVYVPSDTELQEEEDREQAQAIIESLRCAKISVESDDLAAEALLSPDEREQNQIARNAQARQMEMQLQERLAELGLRETDDDVEAAELASPWAFDETPISWAPTSSLSAMPLALDSDMETYGATKERENPHPKVKVDETPLSKLNWALDEAPVPWMPTESVSTMPLTPGSAKGVKKATKSSISPPGFEDLTARHSNDDFAALESDLDDPASNAVSTGTWKPSSERYNMPEIIVAEKEGVGNKTTPHSLTGNFKDLEIEGEDMDFPATETELEDLAATGVETVTKLPSTCINYKTTTRPHLMKKMD